MITLSIICSCRDRLDKMSDFINHYQIFYPEAEIIIVEQCNSQRFLRGQLLNIGFQYSTGGLILFTDIDLRFMSFVDIVSYGKERKHPFYPYTNIEHWGFNGFANYQKLNKPDWKNSHGGMYVFTRSQFIEANGHSNLYFGHSYEDTELQQRAKPERLINTIIHLDHPRVSDHKDVNRNRVIFKQRENRKVQLDGLKQTTSTVSFIDKIDDKIKKVFVEKVGVCSDFKYMELYNKRYGNESSF